MRGVFLINGTKAAAWYTLNVEPGQTIVLRARLSSLEESIDQPFSEEFDRTVNDRKLDADDFYESILPEAMDDEGKAIARQAYGGLLWSKQFYHYVVKS